MSEKLTEKWKMHELEQGYYYIRWSYNIDDEPSYMIDFFNTEDYTGGAFENKQKKFIDEIVSKVPSYEELQSYEKCVDMLFDVNKKWERTIKERKRLEKKLEIATKALKEYAEVETDDWIDSKEVARKALKEMKGVK
jgi:hypothetical protein